MQAALTRLAFYQAFALFKDYTTLEAVRSATQLERLLSMQAGKKEAKAFKEIRDFA